MKLSTIKWMFLPIALLAFAACDDDVEYTITEVDAPVLVSTTPANGATGVETGDITISVTYDKNVFFASSYVSQLSFTGGTLVSADVIGSSATLTVNVNVPTEGTACTLTIPEGVVTGPNEMPAPAVTVQFTTKEAPNVNLNRSLVNPSAIPAAVNVFNYLLENYGTRTLSATMAKDGVNGVTGSWNTAGADDVYEWTGKYPAINCFDYGHLYASPANWIDYNDITPVKDWWDNGGIVAAMWHWNVPTSDPNAGNETITVSDTETAMPSDWSGHVQIPASQFSGARVGSQVTVNIKDVASGAQGSFKDGASWGGLVDEAGKSWDYFDISGESYSMTLDATTLAAIQSNGLIVSGHDYTVVSVTLSGVSSSNVNYSFYAENNSFDPANAVVEGTWENAVFQADLAEAASYLKLLQEAGIPVIWRPFHEAAGGWFWWGKDAASFKAVWTAMFNYFQQEGLNNLIWVWTSETGDNDWYPGDNYVDIIGRDLYGNTTADCANQFNSLTETYSTKMIALSECGYSTYTNSIIGMISEQWAAGARWSWFMPWYDGDNATTFHSDEAWWTDAMGQDFVISREDLPSFAE